VKKWWVPVGAKFDMSVSLQVGMSADIDVSAAIECGLDLHYVENLPTEPVPIAIDLEGKATASIGGQLSVENLGYTATGRLLDQGRVRAAQLLGRRAHQGRRARRRR